MLLSWWLVPSVRQAAPDRAAVSAIEAGRATVCVLGSRLLAAARESSENVAMQAAATTAGAALRSQVELQRQPIQDGARGASELDRKVCRTALTALTLYLRVLAAPKISWN